MNIRRSFPNREALCVKREGQWIKWTYSEYYQDVTRFAKALIHIGVDKFQGVSIIGFNSPEWVIADVGSIFAGCLPAGIYTTNGPDALQYVAGHSGAAVLVIENDEQLDKVLQVRDRLPALKAIVQWSGQVRTDVPGLYSWNAFLDLSQNISDDELTLRSDSLKTGNCCTLIYTSGTTGNPKAVMISHDNITWASKVAIKLLFGDIDVTSSPQRLVSYLPMSHVAAQIVDIHGPMTFAATVYFAAPDALKGSLVQTLTEIRPTQFLGVPRVWEKIEEKMRAVGAANTGVKRKIGDWAKSVGLEGSYAKLKNEELPWGWSVADRLVFSNVKKNLGLDACTVHMTGAAPIGLKTLEYFMSLNVLLYEMYGMSETTGPHTLNLPEGCKIGTVGRTMHGVETRLDNPDGKGNGEICMRGRNIFMGYLFNPVATMETLDSDGWLHSGDIGCFDDKGFLSITGRIKELIITAGGENVAPVLIEEVIKEEIPAISNAVVIGDKMKYLSCLLTLRSEPDANGQPTDEPAGPTQDLISQAGSSARTIQHAIECPKIHQIIDQAMGRVNARAISRAQHVRKWTLLSGDFTLEGGELTPTMKLKRRTVNEKYSSNITAMYPDEDHQSLLARL